jgi:hypothetical protein
VTLSLWLKMSPKSQRPPQYWLQWKSHRDRVEAAAERMILQKDCIRQTPFTPYGKINPSHTPPSLKAYSGIPIYVCEVFGEQGYIPAGKHGIHVGRVCLRGLTPASSRFGERRMRFLAVVLMMGVLMGSGLLSLGSERCLVLCNEGKRFLCRTQSLLQLLMPVTTSLKTRILGGALMNAIGAQTEAYNTTPRGVQVWRGLPWDASTKFDRCQAGVSACVLGLGVLARIMWEKDLHFSHHIPEWILSVTE